MRVGLATDHGGLAPKQELFGRIRAAGHNVVDFGAYALTPNDDYPDFMAPLAPWPSRSAVCTGTSCSTAC
jgi:ribose 5-phosphate isomerase B